MNALATHAICLCSDKSAIKVLYRSKTETLSGEEHFKLASFADFNTERAATQQMILNTIIKCNFLKIKRRIERISDEGFWNARNWFLLGFFMSIPNNPTQVKDVAPFMLPAPQCGKTLY
jgi:hypothetical protein